MPFLDILIKGNGNDIWIDLSDKLTDRQRSIPFASSHSIQSKWNIPFWLAGRIYTTAENNLKSNLSKYHYPDSLIKQGFEKALSVP